MAEQEQNRSEQATPFKLEEARKQGQVAKSLDFNTLVMMWGLLGLAMIWGANAWLEIGQMSAGLFMIQDAHLDALQLVLVGTTLELSAFLFEVPTGVLADTVSRRALLAVCTMAAER